VRRLAYAPRALPPERLLTRPFLVAAAAQFLYSLSFHLYLHLPGYLSDLGAGETTIGLVFATAALASILVRPLIGRLIDSSGSRFVVRWGCVVNVVACTLYLSVESLGPWLYAVRIVHGAAEAMLFASFFVYAADVIPESRRIEGIAIFGVSGLLPVSLGGLIGDFVLAEHDYWTLFLVTVGLALLALLTTAALPRPVRSSDEETAPARGIRATLFEPTLVPLWFVGTAFACALVSVIAFLKTFVLETGIGSVGLYWTTYTIAAVVLRIFLGSLPERVGPKRVLVVSMVLFAVGLTVLAYAETNRGVGVSGGLCGLGHGYLFPIMIGIVVDRAPISDRGSALAIFTALFDAGLLIGGPSLGALVHATSYPVMFQTSAAIALASCAIFILWDRRNDGEPTGRSPAP